MSKVRRRRRRATSNKGGSWKIGEAAAPQGSPLPPPSEDRVAPPSLLAPPRAKSFETLANT
eukprot:gene16979-biopygen11349